MSNIAGRSIRIKKVGNKYQVSGNFSTFVWKDRDSNCFIAFIPELDLVAYHTFKNKALKSLEVVMNEFFRYAIEKRTLDSELIRLGWKETDDTFETISPILATHRLCAG